MLRIDEPATPARSQEALRADVLARSSAYTRRRQRRHAVATMAVIVVIVAAVASGGVESVIDVQTTRPADRGGESGDGGPNAGPDEPDAGDGAGGAEQGEADGRGSDGRQDVQTDDDGGASDGDERSATGPGGAGGDSGGAGGVGQATGGARTELLLRNAGGLYAVSADGGQPTLVHQDSRVQGGTSDARWSPSGRRIAVAVDHRLVVVDLADGSVRTVFTGTPGDQAAAVDWMPDGQTLVFEHRSAAGHGERRLRVVDTSTGRTSDVTPRGWRDGIDVNGRGELLFACDPGGLCVADQDGTNVRHVPDSGGGYRYDWAPDDRTIAATVSAGADVALVLLRDDWEQRRVVMSERARGVVWSADGRRLVVGVDPAEREASLGGDDEPRPCNGAWPCPDESGIWSIATDGSSPVAIAPNTAYSVLDARAS